MKKLVITFVLAVALPLAILAPAMAMDLSEGFIGQKWGMPLTEADGFKKLRTTGIIDYYKNEKITYKFSETETADVVFGGIQDQLFAIFIKLQNEKQYSRMKDYLLSKFGMAKVKDQVDFQEHTWVLYNNKVRVKLKKATNGESMKLAIYYLPLSRPDVPVFNKSLDDSPSAGFNQGPMPPSAIPLLSF